MKPRSLLVVFGILLFAFMAAGCNVDVSSSSDTHVCIYDGDERDGQRLIAQIPPGAGYKSVKDNSEVVRIPASNRFYMAKVGTGRDALAPEFYVGYAQGSVQIKTQGQIRFRFNLTKACEWYAKHGRRNARDGDLGFNVRDLRSQENAGWFKFLQENFGITMGEVISARSNTFEWAALHYNYPTNADESGFVPRGKKAAEAARIAYGRHLGKFFSERLRSNLGGDYFCGIEHVESGTDCPTMSFQVIEVDPSDASLVKTREVIERKRQEIENAEADEDLERRRAELLRRQRKTLLASERTQQDILREKLKTAEIQAQIKVAACVPLARLGLDCEGKRPQIIAGR